MLREIQKLVFYLYTFEFTLDAVILDVKISRGGNLIALIHSRRLHKVGSYSLLYVHMTAHVSSN